MAVQKQIKFVRQGSFYHRKIARSGGSRYIAVGRIIPEDWSIVRVEVLKIVGKVCILQITKLD